MENQYDFKKFAVVYVDDEKMALKAFTLAFGESFRIFTADNAQAGLKLLQEHGDEIGILMTDQRMPGEKGVWLLEQARQLRPSILRILVTAYTDFEAAIEAVNSGAIYKYVSKPWDPAQLEITLRNGLEFFIVQKERDQLLREKMSVLRNMLIADRVVSLGLLAAGLSHHIKNSMVAVKTFLELAPVKMAEEKSADENLRDPDFWKEYHQNVQSQIEKINLLLADLRTASDTQSGLPFSDEVQLRSAVGDVLTGLEPALATRRIQVENQIPENLPTLRVDRPKFNRMLELLFKDELAMLPAGSHIRLEAEPSGDNSKPEVTLRLTDDGPALPADALRVVLDPFTGGAPAEYGINLMACFFIVHHHGGTIQAHSPPNGGNVFNIHLPLRPEPAGNNEDTQFLRKAIMNEGLWDNLIPKP